MALLTHVLFISVKADVMDKDPTIWLATEHQRFLLINGWSVAESIAETSNTSGAHGFT